MLFSKLEKKKRKRKFMRKGEKIQSGIKSSIFKSMELNT